MTALSSFSAVVGMLLPHGTCYQWLDDLIALHAISDALIALAYYSIPLVLLYVVRKRVDLPFRGVVLMFGAFIVACGTTHLLEVATIWQPDYWLSGWVKAVTALVSLATVGMLFRVVPKALQMPMPAALQKMNESLEQRVGARTADLSAANLQLAAEVRQREEAEAEVRRLNASLQKRVNELQALLDLLPVGIGIASDRECQEIRSNKQLAEILGISQDRNASLSAPHDPVNSFVVVQNGQEVAPADLPMQRCARENRPVLDVEITVRRTDGRELHLLANAVPLRDSSGEPHGCVATFQDVTAQKVAGQEKLALERRLQETQKLQSLGVLAGGIAHDFNNLLTGILGNASIARLELPPGHVPVRAALDNLEQSAMRAADLCKQMLAYAGKGRFVVQALSLSGLVRDTAELLDISISKKAALNLHLEEGLPAFQGDATQIRQILMNLVINASEAIGDRNGLITVRTSLVQVTQEYLDRLTYSDQLAPGAFVCLEVSDTGSGMEPATLARIFDPFFTTKFTGRGLGLSAVLGIVRGHKGAIKVYSELGRGTTFKILLPALAQPATPPDPLLHAAVERVAGGKVLLADDEKAVRSVASRVLTNAGFEVVEVENGEKAVERVRATPDAFVAVLLDFTMPVMDGEEAFRLIREIRPNLRIMMMSGFNEQDTTHRFIGRGLDGFLPKPFTAEVLLAKITSLLQSRN